MSNYILIFLEFLGQEGKMSGKGNISFTLKVLSGTIALMKLPENHPLFSKPHPLVLAPMADLTHAGLRCLIDQLGGCDFYFTEMISAGSLCSCGIYEPWYTLSDPAPHITAAQLLGNDPQRLLEASTLLMEQGFSHIDINMGCSAPDILKRQQGAALLKNLPLLFNIVEHLREHLPDSVILSAKIRLGEKMDLPYLIRLGKGLEERGLSFLTLHPKTILEKPARPAHWEFVSSLKEQLSIPLIANGGILTAEQCIRREESSGADAIMLGRAAVQSPWIFREIVNLRNEKAGQSEKAALSIDLARLVKDLFHLIRKYQPQDFWFTRARRFSLYFHKNLKFGYNLHFKHAYNAGTIDKMEQIYEEYFESHPEESIKEIF